MSKDRTNQKFEAGSPRAFAGLKKSPLALLGVLAAFLIFGSCSHRQEPATDKEILFSDFIASVRVAKFEDYSKLQNARVESTDEFEKMRKHLLFLYEGVTPVNTFIGADNQFVDCVPIEQQVGLRNPKTGPLKLQREAPKPAGQETLKKGGGVDSGRAPKERSIADLTLKPGVRDRFGREMYCKIDTVPLRRVTLEEMTRFRTLRDFFSKGGRPFVRGSQRNHDRPGLLVPGDASHYYSDGFQNVNNFGGDSWLNLWTPTVNNHEMSLSQIWVSGGDGDALQTVEAGWQVYPDKWGANAALFIYYTTNGYDDGCYNTQCSGFVQVANNVYLGSGFDHYSQRDGGQWGFNIQVKHHTDGNWWLFYRGPGDYIAFGYYPGAIYGSGAMSRNADTIGWGGEDTGSPSALQEGSGAPPTEGWGRAAYHDVVFYIDTHTVSQWAELYKVEQPADCYKSDISNASANGQKTFFYFGGPNCH